MEGGERERGKERKGQKQGNDGRKGGGERLVFEPESEYYILAKFKHKINHYTYFKIIGWGTVESLSVLI
jgi:hypothetical protein